MRRICISISLVFLLSAGSILGETTIWVAPAEMKVRKLEEEINVPSHIWSPAEGVIKLAGAGREHVFFQIVASCVKDTLRQVNLTWSGLKSNGASIPADNIKAYLAVLVKVYAASDQGCQPGWYPDPLAPLSSSVDIYPERWENRKNQSFWIDIVIPPGQPGGKYTGEIAVTAKWEKVATFPIELTVRDFSLPESFHLSAQFNCSKNWLSNYYEKEILGERTLDDVLVQYFDFMLERGIQPWINPLLQPEVKDKDGRLELSWPDKKWENHFLSHPAYKRVTFSAEPPTMRRLPDEEKFTDQFNQKIKDWVGGIYRHYQENGWEKKLTFFGPVDEPNSREAYEEVIKWGKLVRSVDPGVSFQVTEQPIPSDPDWPSLTQVANDWVVHGTALESNREELIRRLALGDHACWYISCDQLYPMANYFIDQTGSDPRAVAWITWRYKLGGILYWAVNFWPEVRSPWRDPITWKRSSCNAPLAGEGSLLYPGEEIRSYCGLKNVEGPVSSVRFELLRKGMEDVEYLYKLAEMGLASEAERLGMELVISADTFSRDPARLEKIKAEAARLIEQAK
ncbi:MAG TPA: glycoside hydrolase domain-containing protein [archaeon]|nr:glycoside hydrolase domain-containing protein [archaeon]